MRGGRTNGALSTLLAALALLGGCGSTTDTLGFEQSEDGVRGPRLVPLSKPSSYPNPFRDLLKKSDADIQEKIEQAFQRLFHGSDGDRVFFTTSDGSAGYIQDFYHSDVRTEGMGWAMMVCVELDKHTEFDQLWQYAKTTLRYQSGANAGYFRSHCETPNTTIDCSDPFGQQQFVMALVMANDRWQTSSQHDYAEDALELLDVMLNKELYNGGIVDGVTNMFDRSAHLPYHVPEAASAGFTRPSVVMPGYYDLWAQATRDEFWSEAAAASRRWLRSVSTAAPKTGFLGGRADFNGNVLAGWDQLAPEGYRTQLNLAADALWLAKDSWEVDNANLQISFFAGQDTPGRNYDLDGTCLNTCMLELSLVATNGITATIATTDERRKFVQAVWDMSPPVGNLRYYGGMLHLLSLLVLGGQFRVW